MLEKVQVGERLLKEKESTMPEVTISMTTENAVRVDNALQALWPIPLIPDPDFVGDPNDAPLIPEYTPIQWAKIRIIYFLVKTVRRVENKISQDAAAVAEDPDIAT